MRYRPLLLLVCFILPCLSTAKAQAALISIHDSVFGSNSVTLDTATGLEWLDLLKGGRRTISSAIHETRVGGELEGWRHATHSEIDAFFFGSAGLSRAFQNPADPQLIALQSLVGITEFVRFTPFTSGRLTDAAFNDDDSAGVDPLFFGRARLSLNRFGIGSSSSVSVQDAGFGRFSLTHHWLVRSTTVPEPASLSIWLVVAASLCSWRRR